MPAGEESLSDDEFEVDLRMDDLKAAKLLKKAAKTKIDFVKSLDLKIINSIGSIKATNELDVLEDMIGLDIGTLFRDLATRLEDLIAFASSVIGSNMSESFCEREISIVNQIMTTKRTRITDNRLEKLSVLRMNHLFMKKMKKYYPTLFSRLNVIFTEEIFKKK